jgi:hypothetical protein
MSGPLAAAVGKRVVLGALIVFGLCMPVVRFALVRSAVSLFGFVPSLALSQLSAIPVMPASIQSDSQCARCVHLVRYPFMSRQSVIYI